MRNPISLFSLTCRALVAAFLFIGEPESVYSAANDTGGGGASNQPRVSPAKGESEILTDEQGRKYQEDGISKQEARRISPTVVRTVWGGIPIDVIREDESYFYFKRYIVEESPPVRQISPSPQSATTASPLVSVPSGKTLTLQPFDKGLPTAGEWREGFAIADMNGDGFVDIVAPPARKTLRPPAIFLGDGKGGWRYWKEAEYPALGFDYGDAATGDIDGDGIQDMALAIHLHGVVALKGDGKGKFLPWMEGLDFANSNSELDKAYPSRSLLLLDWNRDGRLDIAAQGEGPILGQLSAGGVPNKGYGLTIYLNEGAGHWSRRTGPASSLFGNNLAAGDFDGNGRADLVMASSVLGRNDILAIGQEDGGWSYAALAGLPTKAFIRAVATADYNRDGKDDIALSWLSYGSDKWRSGLDIYLADSHGGWLRKPQLVEDGTDVFTGLASGDINGDALPDLAGVTEAGRLRLYRMQQGVALSRETATDSLSVERCRGSAIRIGDLDKDGNGDIVAMFGQESSDKTHGCPAGGSLRAWKVTPRAVLGGKKRRQ